LNEDFIYFEKDVDCATPQIKKFLVEKALQLKISSALIRDKIMDMLKEAKQMSLNLILQRVDQQLKVTTASNIPLALISRTLQDLLHHPKRYKVGYIPETKTFVLEE